MSFASSRSRALLLASLLALLGGCYESAATTPPEPTPPVDPAEECESGRWCWVHGEPVSTIDGTSLDALFATTTEGALLRWSDGGWRRVPSPVDAGPSEVLARAADDVWLGNGGRLFHFDGAAWSELDTRGSGVPLERWPMRLSGTEDGHVWAHDPLAQLRFDGERWQDFSIGAPATYVEDLLPISATEVWAIVLTEAGNGDLVLRFDGSQWIEMGRANDSSSGLSQLVRVDGELWVMGNGGARRLVDGVWVDVDRALYASDERTTRLVTRAHGIVSVPREVGCQSAIRVEGETLCVTARRELHRSVDGANWAHTPIDPYGQTLSPSDWGRVAPALWAGEAVTAWGVGPERVLRVRSRTTGEGPFDDELMLEHVVAGRFEPVIHDDTGEPIVGRYDADIDGSTDGSAWVVLDGALYRGTGGSMSRVPLPAELADVRLRRVAAIDSGTAVLVAVRDEPATSFVLRVEGDAVTVLMERAAGHSSATSEDLEDVAVDSEGGLWVIGTVGQVGRSEGVGALYHSTGGEWARRDLWSTWGYRSIDVDGDALWIGGGGVNRLPMSAMGTTDALMPTGSDDWTLGPGIDSYDAQLWVAENGVWLTNQHKALWLPR